jgi:hypothetical protein
LRENGTVYFILFRFEKAAEKSNVAAKTLVTLYSIACKVRSQDSADGALKQLHWMPIRYRIKYKLYVLMHGVTVHQSPSYITDIVTATSDIPTKAKLRSATNGSFAVPRTRTEFGKRAFRGDWSTVDTGPQWSLSIFRQIGVEQGK